MNEQGRMVGVPAEQSDFDKHSAAKVLHDSCVAQRKKLDSLLRVVDADLRILRNPPDFIVRTGKLKEIERQRTSLKATIAEMQALEKKALVLIVYHGVLDRGDTPLKKFIPNTTLEGLKREIEKLQVPTYKPLVFLQPEREVVRKAEPKKDDVKQKETEPKKEKKPRKKPEPAPSIDSTPAEMSPAQVQEPEAPSIDDSVDAATLRAIRKIPKRKEFPATSA